MDGELLERQYRNHLSGYLKWESLPHAGDWLLFEKNIGAYVGIDEVWGQRKILRGISDKILSLCETNESSAIMETNGYRLLLPEGTLDYFNIS